MAVFVGEVANFTCGAFGSFITMLWQFDDSFLSCNESGCDNRSAFVKERNTSYSDVNGNITIESTLEIYTDGLSPSNYVIGCVITQVTQDDFAVQGTGASDGTFLSLLMLRSEGNSCMY